MADVFHDDATGAAVWVEVKLGLLHTHRPLVPLPRLVPLRRRGPRDPVRQARRDPCSPHHTSGMRPSASEAEALVQYYDVPPA